MPLRETKLMCSLWYDHSGVNIFQEEEKQYREGVETAKTDRDSKTLGRWETSIKREDGNCSLKNCDIKSSSP